MSLSRTSSFVYLLFTPMNMLPLYAFKSNNLFDVYLIFLFCGCCCHRRCSFCSFNSVFIRTISCFLSEECILYQLYKNICLIEWNINELKWNSVEIREQERVREREIEKIAITITDELVYCMYAHINEEKFDA